MNSHKTLKLLAGILTLILSVSAVILFISYPETKAQTENNNIQCVTEMRPFINEENNKFMEYLKTHFQNKSTNSSLLDPALKRFQLYKNDLRKKFNSYYAEAGKEIISESKDILDCYNQMNTNISLMEEQFKKYFVQTSQIKTSSSLMTKLKAINNKLDALNGSITKMYGKWETIKDRIPCFIKKCL